MKTLFNTTELASLIKSNKSYLIAGSETLLESLPKGNWIGGTIPYFMSEIGGLLSHDLVQAIELPQIASGVQIKSYGIAELHQIPQSYSDNGATFILIPAFSEVHKEYAKNCSMYKNIFNSPLMGWVTGFDLNQAHQIAKVFDGQSGKKYDNSAVTMTFDLPENYFAQINIINLFQQSNGDSIKFKTTGFEIENCLINGVEENFAAYLKRKNINTQLPLVANFMGAMINASFQNITDDTVQMYAPVFPDVEYKIAKPMTDSYEQTFAQKMVGKNISPSFACNCILNYLYANLEGKKTNPIVGPITFGEIAYMLLGSL